MAVNRSVRQKDSGNNELKKAEDKGGNNNNSNNPIERCNSTFFYSLLTAPQTVSNMYALVARAQSCATHRVLIKCNLQCAARYKGTAQLLSFTEFKLHLF